MEAATKTMSDDWDTLEARAREDDAERFRTVEGEEASSETESDDAVEEEEASYETESDDDTKTTPGFVSRSSRAGLVVCP